MTYISDVNSKYVTKYCNNKVRKIPNFYYQELVANDPFVKGFIVAADAIDSALEGLVNDGDRTIDELERSIQRDYISLLKNRISIEVDEMIVNAIDGLSDEEHKSRMEKVFGQEFTDFLESEEEFELSVKEGQDLLKKLIAVESKIEEA